MNTHRHRRAGAALAAVLFTFLSGTAFAEEFQLDEVVVTATMTEETVKDTPVAVEVITEEDIRALGAQDLRSALALATNVDLNEAGMTGNALSVRGMNTYHTLLLVNGRRIAGEDTTETTNVYELSRISLSNVERIEIIRGSASAIYGSDALGGVINIITKRPEEAGGAIGANTGSRQMNNYYHYDFGQIGKFNGSFDMNFQKIRKFSLNDSYQTVQYGTRQNFAFEGEYKFNEARSLIAGVDYMKDHLRQNSSSTGGHSNYDDERRGASLEYRLNTDATDFMVRAYYNSLDKDSNSYRSTGAFYDFDRASYDTFVLESRDTTRISDDHRLTVGGEYRYVKYRGTRLRENGEDITYITINGMTKAQSEQSVNYTAVYLQDEWTPSEKWLIVPSVRYDYSDSFGSATTPKIGVTYKAMDNLRFKVNYGRGYHAPTISELYMEFEGTPSGMPLWIYGNPDLEPEKSLGYDFSVEGEAGSAFAKVSYFRNKVSNLISTAFYPFGSGLINYRYVNVDEADLKGVETELGFHLNDRWTLKGTWNYLDAIDKSNGGRVSGRARNYGTVQLRYRENKENALSGVLWYAFTSDYYDGSDNYSYHTWNISLNKDWNKSLSTFVGVDNILNDDMPDMYIPGRLWRVGAEWRF